MREEALPADIQATAKLVRMRSMAADVECVLREFFTLTESGWTHKRCDSEIAKMQDKQAKARASGIASANARKEFAERTSKAKPTDVEKQPTDVGRPLGELPTDAQLPTPTPTPTPIKDNTVSGPALRAEPPTLPPGPEMIERPTSPPPFDGQNAELLNGKSVVALAAGWDLPEQWGYDAEALGWQPGEVLRESEKFRQYWVAGRGAGTRRSVKGWRQTWSTWLDKASRDKR